SDQQDFTPTQQQTIQKMLDDVYSNFTSGVAAGRNLPIAAVDRIAKGRVWSGEQAKGLGLVDELGDTERAVDVAKQLAHIPASESVEIVRLPKPQSLFDFLLARAQGDVRASQGMYSSAQSLVQRLSAMVRSEPVRAQMPFTLTIR
ncbi:MAG: S49 family peptidase, partial [Candidatus Acidiferrales bacterium]